MNLNNQLNDLFHIITPTRTFTVPIPSQPQPPSQQPQQPTPGQQQPVSAQVPSPSTPAPQPSQPSGIPLAKPVSGQPSIAPSSQPVASKPISPLDLSEEDYNVKIESFTEYDGKKDTKKYLAGIDEKGNVIYKESV